jgi:hypothetical protein
VAREFGGSKRLCSLVELSNRIALALKRKQRPPRELVKTSCFVELRRKTESTDDEELHYIGVEIRFSNQSKQSLCISFDYLSALILSTLQIWSYSEEMNRILS